MSQYHNTKLDIISITEVKTMINAAKPTESIKGDFIA